MNTFPMHLESTTQYERVEKVISFIGEDDSGSFGVLPGHARMMTLLRFGLARFRVLAEDWEYLALPGALAYFLDGESISARGTISGARTTTGLVSRWSKSSSSRKTTSKL